MSQPAELYSTKSDFAYTDAAPQDPLGRVRARAGPQPGDAGPDDRDQHHAAARGAAAAQVRGPRRARRAPRREGHRPDRRRRRATCWRCAGRSTRSRRRWRPSGAPRPTSPPSARPPGWSRCCPTPGSTHLDRAPPVPRRGLPGLAQRPADRDARRPVGQGRPLPAVRSGGRAQPGRARRRRPPSTRAWSSAWSPATPRARPRSCTSTSPRAWARGPRAGSARPPVDPHAPR